MSRVCQGTQSVRRKAQKQPVLCCVDLQGGTSLSAFAQKKKFIKAHEHCKKTPSERVNLSFTECTQVKNDPGELIGQMSSPVSKKINSSKGFSTTTCF